MLMFFKEYLFKPRIENFKIKKVKDINGPFFILIKDFQFKFSFPKDLKILLYMVFFWKVSMDPQILKLSFYKDICELNFFFLVTIFQWIVDWEIHARSWVFKKDLLRNIHDVFFFFNFVSKEFQLTSFEIWFSIDFSELFNFFPRIMDFKNPRTFPKKSFHLMYLKSIFLRTLVKFFFMEFQFHWFVDFFSIKNFEACLKSGFPKLWSPRTFRPLIIDFLNYFSKGIMNFNVDFLN